MCLSCHLGAYGANEEPLLSQLLEVTDEKYARFNSTSIAHMVLAATGYNGQKCRDAALNILRTFIDKVRNSPGTFTEFVLMPFEPVDYYTTQYQTVLALRPDQYPTTREELFGLLGRLFQEEPEPNVRTIGDLMKAASI